MIGAGTRVSLVGCTDEAGNGDTFEDLRSGLAIHFTRPGPSVGFEPFKDSCPLSHLGSSVRAEVYGSEDARGVDIQRQRDRQW